MADAGDECMDWFSFYERLYTMGINTGRSTEPIGLEKYLGPVMAELREHLPAREEADDGPEETTEQHSDPEKEAGAPGVPPGSHEQGNRPSEAS